MNSECYTLNLSDGKTWGFTAVAKLKPWLKSLTQIMQLNLSADASECDSLLRFIAYKSDEHPPCNQHKWDLYKSGKIFRVWHSDEHPEIFVELDTEKQNDKDIRIINMWNTLKPIYKYYTEKGGGPMHAAFGGLNGNGFLIAAKGNTGKSTSILRLPGYYKKLCDDTSLIVKDSNNNYRTHPMPTWSDYICDRKPSIFNVEYSLPLKAVFFLEQADSDEVIPIKAGKAVSRIFESYKQSWNTYWHRMNDKKRKKRQLQTFENSISLAKTVKCYRLKASLHGELWKEIEKVI